MKHLLLLSCVVLTFFRIYAQAPTTPSSNPSYTESNKEGNSLTFSVTKGNGGYRLVIVKKGSPVTAVPENGVNYQVNSSFGQGFELAAGEFAIYANTGTNFTLNGIEPDTEYHFAVFEYNVSGNLPTYLTNPYLAVAIRSAAPPTTQASNLSFSNVAGNKLKLTWTNGDGRGRMVVAREGAPVNVSPTNLASYTSSATFGLGTQIGSGNYVVFKGTATNGSSVDITSLKTNTTYHFAIFEFNGNSAPVFLVPTTATASITTLPRPSVPTSGLTQPSADGDRMRISWTNGNGRERIIIARKDQPVSALPADGVVYTANTKFGQGTEIAPGEFVVYRNTNTQVDIDGLEAATTYHFAAFELDYDAAGLPVYLTSSFPRLQASTLSAPTVPASEIEFSSVTANSARLTWKNGDGGRRLVIGRLGGPVTAIPENYKTYAASTTFGNGSRMDGDHYVVYWSTGNTVTVSGLQQGGDYHFAIFESNGTQGPVYLTTNPARANLSLSSRPTKPTSNLTFSSIEGNAMRMSFTRGDGSARIVIARAGEPVTAVPVDGAEYPANPAFGMGTEIAPGEYVIHNGTNTTAFDLTNLQPNTTYYFAFYEYSGSGSGTEYLTSQHLEGNQATLSAPTVSASDPAITNVTNNSIALSWTRGNGARRLVVVKAGGPVDVDPVQLTKYTVSSNINSASHLGNGNYAVYFSNTSSVTVNGLQPGTEYHFAIFEANGNEGPVYKLTDPARISQTTAGRPTNPSTGHTISQLEPNSARLSWSNGNGTARIMVVREGAPVSFLPQDGETYTADATFGSGQEVAPGEFVMLNGSNSLINMAGLEPGKTYHVAIFEYSLIGSTPMYLQNNFATVVIETPGYPAIPASSILFSSVGANNAVINWTSGSGSRRLVVVRANQPVDFIPVDFQTYQVNAEFGNRQLSSGNYGIYLGTGNSVTITGLTEGEQYHVAVFEMNGLNAPVYKRDEVATAWFTTNGAPTIPASELEYKVLGDYSIRLNWTSGNGQRRLVLGKAGAPVDAVPQANKSYLANAAFGSGEQIGNGNFILYNGTGNSVDVSDLQEGVGYHFAVFEFNQAGTAIMYRTTNPAIVELPADIALPVIWRWFRGKREGNQVRLEWSTGAEFNNRQFEIERSTDGRAYEKIAVVNPGQQGTLINQYQWVGDALPGTHYYRIRQVDEDGKFNYSSVIIVRATESGEIKILRNPASDAIRFQVSESLIGAEVRVVSATGVLVYKGRIQSSSVQIPRQSWRAGVYYLQVSTGTGRLITKPVVFE
ncbi:MAG TPA: T9SS type A sorting domain-containing protein [Flavihumibacter sp.]